MRRVALTLGWLAVACGSDAPVGDPRKPPLDPTGVQDTSTSAPVSTSGEPQDDTGIAGEGERCSASEPCPASTYCVAPDGGGTVVSAGPFACSAQCIDDDDPSFWCLDASACCNADATCSHGICRGPSTTDPDTGSETSSGTDSGPGSSESTAAASTDSSGG